MVGCELLMNTKHNYCFAVAVR